jgi:hypothetical protein
MRPPGDPALLAGAARRMGAAADELERLGRRATAVAHELVAGAGWQGPASRVYLARDGMLEADVRAAATVLRVAGEGLTGLAAGLAAAQATWDRARALAASSGLTLDPTGSSERLALSLPSTDPRVVVAARVSELVHEAEEQAGAADRGAVAGLAEAARMASLMRRMAHRPREPPPRARLAPPAPRGMTGAGPRCSAGRSTSPTGSGWRLAPGSRRSRRAPRRCCGWCVPVRSRRPPLVRCERLPPQSPPPSPQRRPRCCPWPVR